MSQSIQLSSRISPIGTAQLHSAIEGFKRVLDADQRQDFESSNVQPDAATVLKFTAHLDEINSERQSRCIATRLQTVLQSVQQFSTIVETFVSSDPRIAALVWGTLKFALLIASNFGSYFEKLSALFMKFGRHCPRYAEYQGLYLDSTRLQSSLCSFYATLVSCCTRAVDTIKRPGWVHVAKIITLSSFESDFGSFEQELQHWSKEIKDEITAASHTIAERERRAQSEERARAEDHRIWHWRRAKEQEVQMEKLRSLQQKRSLLDKLSDHDYNRPWTRARRQCIVSTGQWLTHTKQFSDWVSDPASSLLCLTGKLGSGKTVLTASAIAELSRHPGNGGSIAYFFCRFDDEVSLHATTILSSLLKQILRPESITPDQQSFLERTINPGPPELWKLKYLLKETMPSTQFIVIDAFDECSGVERGLLLESLQSMMELPDQTVKLFLSSRDSNSWRTKKMFHDAHFVSTNSQESCEDMRTLVKKRLEQLVEDEHLVVGHRDILGEIEDHLLNNAQGMFLWVDFALQDLCSQRRDCDIRAALQRLPIGLPEMYNRLLSQIRNSGERELVPRIFHWIACAKRPVSLEELAEAIAVEPLQKSSEPERYVNDVTQIPSWSRGLFTCDEEDNALQFVHSTVKDFLLGKCQDHANSDFHFEMEITDHELGEICVTYLNFSDFERQLVKQPKPQVFVRGDDLLQVNISATSGRTRISRTVSKVLRRTLKSDAQFTLPQEQSNTTALRDIVGSHPFLQYASRYWIFHCQNFTQATPTWSLWNRLLLSESNVLKTEWTVQELSNREAIIMAFIAKHQHYGLIEWLQTSGNRLRLEQADKLLEDSAEKGEWRMIDKVLDMCHTSQTAMSSTLQIAARCGYLQIVERLLNAGASVNAPPSKLYRRTALQTAAEWGNFPMVEKLLNAGADVNAPPEDHFGLTALQAAAQHGYLSIVEKLLNAGANVDAPPADTVGRTALQAAAEKGYVPVVELLLNAGADTNVPPAKYGKTALQAAAGEGHLSIVEKLLNAGADVDAPPAETAGRTALQAAAEQGHYQVAKMLLNAGANVNALGNKGYGETALQLALRGQHHDVEKLLRESGAISPPDVATGYHYSRSSSSDEESM